MARSHMGQPTPPNPLPLMVPIFSKEEIFMRAQIVEVDPPSPNDIKITDRDHGTRRSICPSARVEAQLLPELGTMKSRKSTKSAQSTISPVPDLSQSEPASPTTLYGRPIRLRIPNVQLASRRGYEKAKPVRVRASDSSQTEDCAEDLASHTAVCGDLLDVCDDICTDTDNDNVNLSRRAHFDSVEYNECIRVEVSSCECEGLHDLDICDLREAEESWFTLDAELNFNLLEQLSAQSCLQKVNAVAVDIPEVKSASPRPNVKKGKKRSSSVSFTDEHIHYSGQFFENVLYSGPVG
jgi:hypothetical protein